MNKSEILTALDDASTARINAFVAIDTAASAERRLALYDMAAFLMARGDYQLTKKEKEHNPLSPPAWMKVARAKLVEHMLAHPNDQPALTETPFFGDPHAKRNFANRVSASIRPYGDYSDRVLATRLLSGRITVKPS